LLHSGIHTELFFGPNALPILDPGPCSDIGNAVFALAFSGQVLTRLISILTAQSNFKNANNAERFILEALFNLCLAFDSVRVSSNKNPP